MDLAPIPYSLMPGAAMVILETTTCAMPFTAALCERERPAQPHRSACAPKICPIHPAQPHRAHPGASQLVVVLVRHRDPVDDLPEGTGSGVALGLCHPRPMLPPSGHGLAVTGTPHPQGAPPKIPHNTRTPRTHGHLQKGFGSETSPSRAPKGHPHPQTSLLLRSRPSHPLGVLNMGTGTTHRGRTHSLLPHHRDVHAVGGGHSCERDPAGEQRGGSLRERGQHQHRGQDDTKPLGAGGEGNRPVLGMRVSLGRGLGGGSLPRSPPTLV